MSTTKKITRIAKTTALLRSTMKPYQSGVDTDTMRYAHSNATPDYIYESALCQKIAVSDGTVIYLDESFNDLSAHGDIYLADTLVHMGDTDTKLVFGTNTINLFAAGIDALSVASNGTIGVGTTAPSSPLDVQKAGTIRAVADILELTNSIGGGCGANLGNGAALILKACLGTDANNSPEIAGRIAAIDNGVGNSSDSYLSFQTAAAGVVAEKMRLSSAGLLGLGVTPTAQIDVFATGATSDYQKLRLSGLNHGMITLAETNVFERKYVSDATYGGSSTLVLSSGDICPMVIQSVVGNITTTHPTFLLLGAKKASVGTAWQGLLATEKLLEVANLTTPVMDLYGNGNLSVVGDVYTTAFTTWNPTISVSGGTTPQYSTTNAHYKQIGKTVRFWLTLTGDGGNEGAGAAALLITLPVNANAGLYASTADVIGSGRSVNSSTYLPVTVHASHLYMITSTGSTFAGDSQNNTVRSIYICGTYEAA